ncbi:MAG: two component transcriptional regulator, winged helix family [Verrucomicrobiales bacterium]|nr:two component transcriptional regulator, winged helix family [Verrucomicrobiales bacterium]
MRLLVVEDEVKLANAIAIALRAERFAVDIVHDGREGLEAATLREYDCIILDLRLPRVSGTQILQSLRKSGKEVPVLILTASGGTVDKVLHFEAGANDYLTKPFAFAELCVRVKALLKRNTQARGNVLQVADLELDLLTQTARRGGKRIELTSKEYGLLAYLMSSPGRVFSRTMIIEHVWDDSFEGLTNIVDVYLRHLRKKIDDPFQKKLLRTIRGMGYSISPAEDL